MTVAELIAQLQRYPTDEPVIVRVGGNDLFQIAAVEGEPDNPGTLIPVPLLTLGARLLPLTGLPTLDDVLAGVSYDEPRTVMEVGVAVAGRHSWDMRGTIRNRLYELERLGLAINDEQRPQRWIRPELPSRGYRNGGPTS